MDVRNTVIGLLTLGLTASATQAADQVRVTANGDGVAVSYRFDSPRDRLRPATSPNDAVVMRLPDGASMQEGEIVLAAPSDALTLDLSPDLRRVDATYPTLTRVGSGWLVFMPSLLADPASDAVSFDIPDGWTAVRGGVGSGLNGMVYVGPADQIDGPLISGDEVPDEIRQNARQALSQTLGWIQDHLQTPPPVTPVISMALLPGQANNTMIGDVTRNGVISLQFRHTETAEDRAEVTDALTAFAAHEVFHLWNGSTLDPDETLNLRWLSEGGAEYVSILAMEALDGDTAAMGARLGTHLKGCVIRLPAGESLLVQTGQVRETTRYSCGVLAMWMADAGLRQASGGERDIFTVWRDMLAGDRYGVADFRRLTADAESGGLGALLDGGWSRQGVVDQMAALGVTLDVVPVTDFQWALAAVAATIYGACPGATGYVSGDSGFRADAAEGCAGLGPHPAIRAINGYPLDSQAKAAYDSVKAACAAAETVTLTLIKDGREAEAPTTTCGRLGAPTVNYTVSHDLRGVLTPR